MGWKTILGGIIGGVATFVLTYDPPGEAVNLGQPLMAIGSFLALIAAILVPVGLRSADAKLMTKFDAIETKLNGEPPKKK